MYICIYIYISQASRCAIVRAPLSSLKKKKRQVNHNGTVFFLVGFNAMAEVG